MPCIRPPRITRRALRNRATAGLALALCGCGGGGGTAPQTVAVGTGSQPGSVQISATPSALTIPAGGAAGILVTTKPATAAASTLSLNGAPAGISLAAGNGAGPAASPLAETLSVAATVPPGTYSLRLDGGGGAAGSATTLTLLVNPALPPALAQVEQQTFEYFWNTTNPVNGLAPDYFPGSAYASIAATGFALSAYPIGVQNGWITRAQAVQRVQTTLQFLASLPQGSTSAEDAGYHGFFYHFLDINTGLRYHGAEVSSVDTALLFAGVLFDSSYFDQNDPAEAQIRALAGQLFDAVDWAWMTQADAPLINLAWTPETGFSLYNWQGYNEAMILYLEALGSPTHPITADAWSGWSAPYPKDWGTYYGRPQLSFAPLFGHQYSEGWVDFRGIQDAFMRGAGIDYFINSRRATESQQSYAIANPGGWRGYGGDLWGLTACAGPGEFTLMDANGQQRVFHSYLARGAGITGTQDDGTIAPTAALSSINFAPATVIHTVLAMQGSYGAYIQGTYGFYDAFNPSFTYTSVTPDSGTVTPGAGWVDSEYLGIDQGPIVMMLENYRSGLVWNVMRQNSVIQAGLKRAGFTGGWLAGNPAVQ